MQMLSSRRKTLMGIATILVFIYHLSINLTSWCLIDAVKHSCDIGVDIFLVLSGYGVYFSLESGKSDSHFYVARVKRIIPEYLMVSIPWFILSDFISHANGIKIYLLDVSTLSFWIMGRLTSWFIPAILVFYLLSPCFVLLVTLQA